MSTQIIQNIVCHDIWSTFTVHHTFALECDLFICMMCTHMKYEYIKLYAKAFIWTSLIYINMLNCLFMTINIYMEQK